MAAVVLKRESKIQSPLQRILPVGLALAPISILFGILAAQAKFNAVEVFLMSFIGFTGSGQFAFLMFTNQGLQNIGILVIFLMILCLNLRYIPMSLSVSQPLKTSSINKFFLAHWLTDEAYATEHIKDGIKDRFIIRICILFFWCLFTFIGVKLGQTIPKFIDLFLVGLTFPISAILAALSFCRIKLYILHKHDSKRQNLIQIITCFIFCVFTIYALGIKYFWIPSIISSYLILGSTFFKQDISCETG